MHPAQWGPAQVKIIDNQFLQEALLPSNYFVFTAN